MQKTILIIEDVPETLALLKWRAERQDFNCLLDETGSHWVDHVAQQKPDAVLMDMDLPRMSGFGILREFKKRAHLKEVPIFILSGIYNHEVRKEAYALGATEYFGKGEDLDHIFRKIHECLHMQPAA